MADRAKSAPRPEDIERRRANDNTVKRGEAASRTPTGPVDRPSRNPGHRDRQHASLAIRRDRAPLSAAARDIDEIRPVAHRQDDDSVAQRFFERRFAVVAVLLGVAIVAAALALS